MHASLIGVFRRPITLFHVDLVRETIIRSGAGKSLLRLRQSIKLQGQLIYAISIHGTLGDSERDVIAPFSGLRPVVHIRFVLALWQMIPHKIRT